MTYLPLARKWRPQTFADVVGQEPVTTTLTHAIQFDRVAAAYLFAGPRGVGKTSTARILAKCLNCAQGPTATPCQTCDTCQAITAGNSLDVLEIDGASNRGIDQIRELREHVKYRPSRGRFKMYIIDEVHQITPDGFNALLKTLEEPPPHVRFIFATTQPEKVLPTILSRCQRFDFRRVLVAQLVASLRAIAAAERIQVAEEALFAIARAADGSVRDAESMLDQLWNFSEGTLTAAVVTNLLGLVEQERLLHMVAAIVARDAAAALRDIDDLINRGKDVTHISLGLTETARHLLLTRMLTTTDAQPVAWPELERLIELPRETLATYVERCQAATVPEWLYLVQLLARTTETVRRSQHGRIHLELMVVKLATRSDFTALQTLLDAAAPATPPPPTAPRKAPPPPAPVETMAERSLHASHTALTIENIQRDWAVLVEHVGQFRMAVASCLSVWKPLELVGDRLVLGVPDVALHREFLDTNGNKQLVERIFREHFGVSRLVVSVRPVAVAEVPPPTTSNPEQRTSDIVQSAIKMFNAKVIESSASKQ